MTSICEGAFSECSTITYAALPEGCRTIARSAFSACSGLRIVYIPDSVRTIEKDAFAYCKNLTIECVTGSAAEDYAEKEQIPFMDTEKRNEPDLNGDGICDHADAELVQSFLLGKYIRSANMPRADINRDGILNAVDLSLLRQALLKKSGKPA